MAIVASIPVQSNCPLEGSTVSQGSTSQKRRVEIGNEGNGVKVCSIVMPKKSDVMGVSGFGGTSVVSNGLPSYVNDPGEPEAPGLLTAVPLRLITAGPLGEELLVMMICPVTLPAVVGSYFTLIVADWLGFKVSGNAGPDNVNPVPVNVAMLTVTGAVPPDVNSTDCVSSVFSGMFPKLKLVELISRDGTYELSCSAKVWDTPFALADKVANWEAGTERTCAVN
jgi:hypothetical protein